MKLMFIKWLPVVILSTLLLGNFSCKKKILNAIPDECYAFESATFSVNNVKQQIKEGTFEGANLYATFGARGTGEWGVTLESEQFLISISMAAFMTNEAYDKMSKEAWINRLNQDGSANLKTTALLNQMFFQDFEKNLLFKQEDLIAGSARMYYVENDDCTLLKVTYDLMFLVDEIAVPVEGEFTVPTPKKI